MFPRLRHAALGLLLAGATAAALAPPATAAAPSPTTMHVTVVAHDLRVYLGWTGATRPTGELHFYVDSRHVGTLTVPDYSTPGVAVQGYQLVAQLPYTIASGASHQIEARYTGDGTYAPVTQTALRKDPRIAVHSVSATKVTRFHWYRTPVTVKFSCVATTSTVTCPQSVRFAKSNANQYAIGVASGGDGGRSTVVKKINLDRGKPWVSAHRVHGIPTFRCSDGLSGIAHCTVVRFMKSGVKYYRGTAVDKAGNGRSLTVRR